MLFVTRMMLRSMPMAHREGYGNALVGDGDGNGDCDWVGIGDGNGDC